MLQQEQQALSVARVRRCRSATASHHPGFRAACCSPGARRSASSGSRQQQAKRMCTRGLRPAAVACKQAAGASQALARPPEQRWQAAIVDALASAWHPSPKGCLAFRTRLERALISDTILRQMGLGLALQAAPLLVCGGARHPKLRWREHQYQTTLPAGLDWNSRPHQWLFAVPATAPLQWLAACCRTDLAQSSLQTAECRSHASQASICDCLQHPSCCSDIVCGFPGWPARL